MFNFRQMADAIAKIWLVLIAVLFVSCQPVNEENGAAQLSVLEWSGFQKPKFYPDYTLKYGVAPEFTLFAHTNDALQRMRSGYKVDVVHLCTGQMKEARKAGLIKEIDVSRVARWNEITPELLDLPDARMDGKYWIAPWNWGYSTIGYNPEMIDVKDPTYDIFIDPRFKGQVALPSDTGVNLYIASVIGRWKDPMDPTEEEMRAAPDIFQKMLRNARFIWTDSTQLEQAWANGDVGISYIYGSASRRMPKEGLPIVVVEPLLTWMCGLSVATTGIASEDQVYDYINAMLDPRSGVELFNEYGYGHGNSKAITRMSPDSFAGSGIDDPAGTFARGIYSGALPPQKKARLMQLWYETQAALD